MSSFIGEYSCKMDDKGRVPLPATFRAALGNNAAIHLVAKKDEYLDCLAVMTEPEWERRIAIIDQELNLYDKEDQILRDALHRNKASFDLDNIGRILIPKKLCEKANISKEIVFVGAGNEIKLWAKDIYDKTVLSDDDFAARLQKRLGNKKKDE
ncbi:transcriptional regulator MraZ [Bacteroidia bacterium]|nr:transcriptional regulator MraZ [Bacteroidia bacterium]